jgi:hypothetical protein
MKKFSLTLSSIAWLEVLLEERFGVKIALTHDSDGITLELTSFNKGKIVFPRLLSCFALPSSDLPFATWDPRSEDWCSVLDQPLPVVGLSREELARLQHPLIELNKDTATIHYDILGLTYWMLARIEEVGRKDLDQHQRFASSSSHAFKHGYLERPIVDEWLHLLGQVIKRVWPAVTLKEHHFNMKVSHDVDAPSSSIFSSWFTVFKQMAEQLLFHRNIKAAIRTFRVKLSGSKKIPLKDPNNTFDWLMDQSEENNLKSAFYFVCGGNHRYDPDYQINDERIRQLIRHIHARGHELGLHPSYMTFQSPTSLLLRHSQATKPLSKDSLVGVSGAVQVPLEQKRSIAVSHQYH